MATFAYGRVSTKDQTTENQRLEIERAGFKVNYWFNDEGVSGSSHAYQPPTVQGVAWSDQKRRNLDCLKA